MAANATMQATLETWDERRWPPAQGEWTYDDYARLPDNGVRYEIIEGELFMSPAPLTKHQRAVLKAALLFSAFVDSNLSGEIFIAPIDVILPGRATPVQPDVVFIAQANASMVKEPFIEGVPDLIVEVLSPGSVRHDRRTKFHLYARAGVKEYWIVDPEARMIEVYVLRGQAYALLGSFGADDEARSEVLPGFAVRVGDVCVA